MNRTRLAVAVLAVSTCAAVALGQNADKNTAGPTKNDYRLRVIEPAEGASINGPTVRVVVDTNVREQLDGERVDVNSMPRPIVDVWLDGTRRGTMKDAENVIEIDNVSPGSHKLSLVAKNRANEIIDKKEINFNSAGSTVEGANSSGTTLADNTGANPATSGSYGYGSSSGGYGSANGSTDTSKSTTGTAGMTGTTGTTSSDSSLAGPSSTSSSTYTPPQRTSSMANQSSSTSNQSSTTTRNSTSPSTSDTMSTAQNRTRARMPATASNDGALLLAGGALLLGSYLVRRKA